MKIEALLKVVVTTLESTTKSKIYAYDQKRFHAVLTTQETNLISIARGRFDRAIARYGLDIVEDSPDEIVIADSMFTAVIMLRPLKRKTCLFVEVG